MIYIEVPTISAILYCRIFLYNGYNLSRGNTIFFPQRFREFLRMRNGVRYQRLSWPLKTRPVIEEEWIASADAWILLLIIKYRTQVAKFIGL